jgi:2-polyprenyl-3-methyl-5-hydroxy-6-metoxy-1,4-benzoquinol methylase
MKQAHVHRYNEAACFVSGRVVDLACGWGMGTSILADVDMVDSVFGMDADLEAINFASRQCPNIAFGISDFNSPDFHVPTAVDWVVSLETIEHLEDPIQFVAKIKDAAAVGVVVSVPIEPTKSKNAFHLHDFTADQVDSWFPRWTIKADRRLMQKVGNRTIALGKLGVYLKP